MKIKENIYVLELPNINPQSKDFVYPTVIKDKNNLTVKITEHYQTNQKCP